MLLGIGVDDTFVLMQGLAMFPPRTKVNLTQTRTIAPTLTPTLTPALTPAPCPTPTLTRTKGGVEMDVPERMANTLALAGASITVTSLTDIIAFVLGTTSSLPGLQAFCVCARLVRARVRVRVSAAARPPLPSTPHHSPFTLTLTFHPHPYPP